MKVVLGSQSAARRSLLARLVPNFATTAANIDEQAIRSDDHSLLPLLVARAKADALIDQLPPDSLLVTCDQVVVCNGELREKPASPEEARRWLESYASFPAQTNTGVVVHSVATGARFEGVDIARVHFRELPASVIANLIADESVYRAAGGFLVEDPRFQACLVRIEGTFDSIMGLPLALTEHLLRAAGYRKP